MTVTTIILESDDPTPSLVSGVQTRFFDTGGSLVTTGTSDANGEVIVDIPDADYDLYFFKSGVSVNDGMPQRITVDSADPDNPPNTFKVKVHVHSLPESVDPTLVRISGNLIGADGKATKDGHLTLAPIYDTGVYEGKVLSPKHTKETHPDEDGYYEFDLIRGLEYNLYFYALETLFGKEPPVLHVIAPDVAALDIKDLLFPLPIDGTFSSNTLSLNAGDSVDESITFIITYSDGSTNSDRSSPPDFTNYKLKSDDEDVATVEQQDGKVLVKPLSAGTANITIERVMGTKLFYEPLPSFTTETLVVTVS